MTDDATIGGPPRIPGFRYESSLGAGGFAEVYRYEQLALKRSVAVKVLHGLDETALRAFRDEAHVMARLSSHPSIVPIYQVGESDDGRPYLVMQLCPPPHLADRIRDGGLPIPTVLEAGVQLAGAVETAHQLGILHRDIKPANILFSEYGRPMLADFGIASSAAVETPLHAFSPAWAPPEQVEHGAATPQCDIYALAATLWAMLTGQPPDGPASADSTRRLTGRDDVPRLLQDAITTGMEREPADRYDTALELGRCLQHVQQQLRLPVTTVELWDGRSREETQAQSPAAPAQAADRQTQLIPLGAAPSPHPAPPARPWPAPSQSPKPPADGVESPAAVGSAGGWKTPSASPAGTPKASSAPSSDVGMPSTALPIPDAPRRSGAGPVIAAVAVLVVCLIALVFGVWTLLDRPDDGPTPGGTTSTTSTTPPPSVTPQEPTRSAPPPAPTPTDAPEGSHPTSSEQGIGGGGWGT